MNVVYLGRDIILRLIGQPEFYTQVPFMAPIQGPGMRLAKQNAKCASCARHQLEPVMRSMDAAFTRLVVEESKKQPNSIPALKAAINGILHSPVEEIRLSYNDNGKPAELVF